jgi:hypothetical protein
MGRWKTVRDIDPQDPATVELKVWLVRNGVRVRDIARSVRFTESHVSSYIYGRATSPRICEWLARNGCPVEILDGLARKYRINVEARNSKLTTCKDKYGQSKTTGLRNQT